MSTRLVNIDRNTPMLLPVDLRDWVPEDDLVHFVIAAVDGMKLSGLQVNVRGTGSAQYPPKMMLSLLIFCYAQGVFSSRRIQRATYRDLAVRYLTADTHPDHDTICAFRCENLDLIAEAFLEVLKLAKAMNLLKVGAISVDGTHVRANASKHKNVTYERAVELQEQLRKDIAELLEQAKTADAKENADPSKLPDEIARREALLAKMEKAKAEVEAQAKERAALERVEYERKLKARKERQESGRSGGTPPKEPDDKPQAKDQVNLTDPDSRLMKKGHGEYQQNYNAQVAVDVNSMLIVATGVTHCANDSQQLEPMIKAVPAEMGLVTTALADTGYVNSQVMKRLQEEKVLEDGSKVPGVDLYVAVGRDDNQRIYDYRPEAVLNKPEKEPVDPVLKAMKEKLKTPQGKRIYAKRKQTAEPVLGIIKQAMGFRQHLLRGLEKVRGEWTLVCTAFDIRRIHSLLMQITCP
jgi:transposase